jgi:hypothetical protein
MSIKDRLAQELEDLSDTQLKLVGEYVSFLKFQSRVQASPVLPEEQWAALYAEFAEEDRQLAEMGIADFARGLAKEER